MKKVICKWQCAVLFATCKLLTMDVLVCNQADVSQLSTSGWSAQRTSAAES